MIEKVNPSHPDKVADRIAGAIVDLAYSIEKDPKIAVEVLIGHWECDIIIETSVDLSKYETAIKNIVERISGFDIWDDTRIKIVPQDKHLAKNQSKKMRCGDNGIFKGVPLTQEEKELTKIAHDMYKRFGTDGKYVIDDDRLIICQSKARKEAILYYLSPVVPFDYVIVNPLGEWEGGINVDTGATNRKLGSDLGHSVTGGGIHGKDLSKADVSVNIYAFLEAQRTGKPVEISCAIGDDSIDGKPYSEIVGIAREYINKVGGFEKFAEWGLV